MIDTKSARRRLVAFASYGDLARDLDRLEAGQRAGTVRKLGNREPGPIFGHLATSIDGSFDGMPELKNAAPLVLRIVGPLVKRRVLAAPLRPGVRMSSTAENALWDDSFSFDEGARRLRAAIARLDRPNAKPGAAHPVFGRLSPQEWKTFHLRHAELHLSVLQP